MSSCLVHWRHSSQQHPWLQRGCGYLQARGPEQAFHTVACAWGSSCLCRVQMCPGARPLVTHLVNGPGWLQGSQAHLPPASRLCQDQVYPREVQDSHVNQPMVLNGRSSWDRGRGDFQTWGGAEELLLPLTSAHHLAGGLRPARTHQGLQQRQ